MCNHICMIGLPTVHEHGDGRQTWLRSHVQRKPQIPPVVLLHGWTLSADEQWHAVYPWLAERTSFVALDHPGHGRSDPPADAFTLEDAAQRCVEVIQQRFREPVTLVGFSLGGPVALHVAATHPELVSGLVLASTTHHFDRSHLMRLVMPLCETAVRSRLVDRLRRREERRASLPPAESSARPRLHPQTVTTAARCLNGIDLSTLCSRISAPATVIVTTADRMIPPQRQRDLAYLLHAIVTEVDGPHTIYARFPNRFADAIANAIQQISHQQISHQQISHQQGERP
jgi:3-oxoadipate enol-lactonase